MAEEGTVNTAEKIRAIRNCIKMVTESVQRADSRRDSLVRQMDAARTMISGVASSLPGDDEESREYLGMVHEAVGSCKWLVNSMMADGADESDSSEQPSQQGSSIASLQRQVSADMGLDSLAGLQQAKQMLAEAVVLPMRFRHLFTGACKPWKSVLLYGPPGTGKTRLALAVAAEVGAELYVVSPADLLSSWFGKTEQNIRDLFGQLRRRALSRSVIVFIDEVDGLCRRRSHEETESTRRMKTELLNQLQDEAASAPSSPLPSPATSPATSPTASPAGVAGDAGNRPPSAQGQLFYVCATNCPWEIDPAFLRRFQRRIFITLPDRESRLEMIRKLTAGSNLGLVVGSQWDRILDATEGFSGSDVADLVKNALHQPIREMCLATHWARDVAGCWVPACENTTGAVRRPLCSLPSNMVRARKVTVADFSAVLSTARPTVGREDLFRYDRFTNEFGQVG